MRQKRSRLYTSDFDRSFASSQRTARRTFKLVGALIVAQLLVVLCIIGAIAFVAYHFLEKAW